MRMRTGEGVALGPHVLSHVECTTFRAREDNRHCLTLTFGSYIIESGFGNVLGTFA